jgi:FAD/FMN-containing dehydrogenase
VTVLIGLKSLDRGLEVLKLLQRTVPSLQAVDFFELSGLRHVCRRLRLPPPFERDFGTYLVVECAGASDPSGELESLVEIADAAVAASDTEGRRRLWLYREGHNETISALGVPHKLDVSVPIGSLPRFAKDVRTVVHGVDACAEVILFGHLGDGNVHVNVLGPPPEDRRVDQAVFDLVASVGGSISAEHGIGLAKTEWLALTRSATEIAAMRAIKVALDPLGILNPGRVLPSAEPVGVPVATGPGQG